MPYNTDHPFGGFSNEVLEAIIKDELATRLQMSRFYDTDFSLTTADGLIKTIHRYHLAEGSEVQELERAAKNDKFINAAFDTYKYEAKRFQGTISYADDDLYKDSAYVAALIKYLGQSWENSMTTRAVNEFAKTENVIGLSDSLNLGDFADMLNQYTKVYENTEGLFWLASQDLEATIIKSLGSELMYIEDFIRVGSRGAVLGQPLFFSKALPSKTLFLATRDAVKCYVKADVNVESTRDIEAKTNTSVISSYAVISLVDDTKCIQGGKEMAVPVTITTATKNTSVIAGAATTGARVVAYGKDGTILGAATASGNEYEITMTEGTLAAGDEIKVIADGIPGYIKSIYRFTVAE